MKASLSFSPGWISVVILASDHLSNTPDKLRASGARRKASTLSAPRPCPVGPDTVCSAARLASSRSNSEGVPATVGTAVVDGGSPPTAGEADNHLKEEAASCGRRSQEASIVRERDTGRKFPVHECPRCCLAAAVVSQGK